MLDLTIIILTYNEEEHIGRTISNALRLTSNIVVVDSNSTDKTTEIALNFGVEIRQYRWDSNSNWSKKMNWSLENNPFNTKWIMRLDADEYMTDEYITTIIELLPQQGSEISAISVNRREYFMRRWMKHGGIYPKSMIRIIKRGKAHYENRLLDEHVEVSEGIILYLNIDLCDDRQISLSDWINKHNSYSLKEAIMLIDNDIDIFESLNNNLKIDTNSLKKRKKKNLYAKLPLFWRAWLYFFYRYFVKMAFLDGVEGFIYSFFQCLWYRILADAKVFEIYKICGKNKKEIKKYLIKEHQIEFNKGN